MPEMENSGVRRIPNAQEVRDAIIRRINDSEIAFSEWCVGVAADPRTRLFADHRVGKNVPWIFRDTGSEEAAMAIREFIIDTYGTKGNSWNGEGTARYIYAYAVTEKTGQEDTDETRS
jgi:hypothetical protein